MRTSLSYPVNMNLVWLKYERFVNNEGISLKTPLLLLIFRGKYDTIFLRKTQEKKKDEGKERGRKGADENVWKRRSKGISEGKRNPLSLGGA